MSPNFSDAFSELAAANADLSTAMHARYMIRRFRSMGILAAYIEHKGEFSHIFIPANDGAYLKIRPARVEVDGQQEEQPLLTWIDFPEPLFSLLKDSKKPTGYYRYEAQITLEVDDYDPEYPDRQTIASEDGPCELARFTFGSRDFQQFIFGAIFHIKEETGFEVYPEFRKSRVAL